MKQCSIKTKTKSTISGVFTVFAFADKIEDDSTSPEVFNSDILDEESIVNRVNGLIGENILSSGLKVDSKIENGELIITTSDDADDYFINENGELCYCKLFENSLIDGDAAEDINFDGLIDGGELENEYLSPNVIDLGNSLTEL